ncbi:MAG: type II toxin-antitoxin system MqsA family antitoxin [Chloroflexi bacterium]|nr:type II toxin-antitoxin system MqsA family antitoxin [Chloroflexota bacterium]
MKTCFFCKGDIEPRRIEHVHEWGTEIFIFRNVPADVCRQCGEVFFGPDALEAMDKVVTKHPKPETHRSVPVYSL